MAELHKSVAFTEQERSGLQYLAQLQDVRRLLQQHRTQEHLRLAANQANDSKALRDAIGARLGKLEQFQQDAGALAGLTEFKAMRDNWTALQQRRSSLQARDSFTLHSAMIASADRLSDQVADRARLSQDPEVRTVYLIASYLKTFPDLTENLAVIASRGAAYIDSGLFEAGEDQLVNATAMLARHELDRLPAQYQRILENDPSLKPLLEPSLSAVPAGLAFLERSKNEVTNSYNQTSGKEFNAAGVGAIDALHALAGSTAKALDQLLAERAERDAMRRNLILAAVLAAIALASWLGAGFYASYSRDVAALNQAVQAAAAGDLSVRIASPARDEIGSLTNAFGAMTVALEALVGDIRSGAERIAQAADELASGNESLSGQTSSQSEALSDTVASMKELDATVQRNSAHADNGRELVEAAAGIARRGGDRVNAVVDTMASIRTSSDRIADIIGVIDGIAFQTNILALNAAVEAARAGEQGRGFAVVAGEVRNLAQRSAAAALEIKHLIGDSVGKVEAGNALVGEAGETMAQVVKSVQRMEAVIGQISAAEKGQRGEIAQLSDALLRIDDMNRQNAALVLQASVGASRVHEETAMLSDALNRFRLGGAQRGIFNSAPPRIALRY
jgi:methyl-accepting chemotaxis protein